MILERRNIIRTSLAAIATGAGAASVKTLLGPNKPKLKGPVADTAAEALAAAETPLAMSAHLIRPAATQAAGDVRHAFLHNTHTGEMLNVVYYENGRYVAGALVEAKRVLRDWRNNQQHFIHPHLFDLLHDLRAKLETKAPFQILSGYRSPATNAMLHAHSEQVASKSQHMLGKAMDINVPGINLANLHKAALSLRAGGVGYYPESGFVHVDVGPLRQWAGT